MGGGEGVIEPSNGSSSSNSLSPRPRPPHTPAQHHFAHSASSTEMTAQKTAPLRTGEETESPPIQRRRREGATLAPFVPSSRARPGPLPKLRMLRADGRVAPLAELSPLRASPLENDDGSLTVARLKPLGFGAARKLQAAAGSLVTEGNNPSPATHTRTAAPNSQTPRLGKPRPASFWVFSALLLRAPEWIQAGGRGKQVRACARLWTGRSVMHLCWLESRSNETVKEGVRVRVLVHARVHLWRRDRVPLNSEPDGEAARARRRLRWTGVVLLRCFPGSSCALVAAAHSEGEIKIIISPALSFSSH